MTKSTASLQPGDVVLTAPLTATDFGIPLVRPSKGRQRGSWRTVRRALHTQGGMVVWFADGTKSAPLHGRTGWVTE